MVINPEFTLKRWSMLTKEDWKVLKPKEEYIALLSGARR